MSDKMAKLKKKVSHKKKKEEKSDVDEDEDFESSEEELDLTKECHPIGHYINDRAEMINQMFSVIKGKKLKAMLPPILKSEDIDQLKLQCLDQLLGMSSKRIQCIIEGEVLDTSSESEVMSDDEEENHSSKSSSSDSEDHKKEDYNKKSRHSSKRKKSRLHRESKSNHKTLKVEPESPAPEQGKTLLEILELEMRARAIRALLSQGNEGEHSTNTADVGEVVDLTEDDEIPPVKVIEGNNQQINGASLNGKKLLEASSEANSIPKGVTKETDSAVVQEAKIENEVKLRTTGSESPKIVPASSNAEKQQKLKAELELRNKLFKKKIYRTRQQRLENLEKEEPRERKQIVKENFVLEEVVIKQEPEEPKEIVIEDPEDGEISTEEDEYPVLIKQEIEEPAPVEPEEEPEIDPQKLKGVEFISSYPAGPSTPVYHTAEPLSKVLEESGSKVDDNYFNNQEMIESSSNNPQLAEDQDTTTDDSRSNFINEDTQPDVSDQPSEEPQQVNKEIVENSSWYSRWMQNDDVQKVVKSSKIMSKAKKRMKSAQAERQLIKNKESSPAIVEEVTSDSITLEVPNTYIVEGSVEEYQKLMSTSKPENKDQASNDQNILEKKDETDTMENNSKEILSEPTQNIGT